MVFIGNDVAAGTQLIQSMGGSMAEGAVFPLDSRLRPDGEKGVLVTPLAAYREYFEKRAQFWEAQALTKARAFYGPEANHSMPLSAKSGDTDARARRSKGRLHGCTSELSKSAQKESICLILKREGWTDRDRVPRSIAPDETSIVRNEYASSD